MCRCLILLRPDEGKVGGEMEAGDLGGWVDFGCFVLEDGGTWIWGCPSCPIGSDLVCFWYKLFLKALRQALEAGGISCLCY